MLLGELLCPVLPRHFLDQPVHQADLPLLSAFLQLLGGFRHKRIVIGTAVQILGVDGVFAGPLHPDRDRGARIDKEQFVAFPQEGFLPLCLKALQLIFFHPLSRQIGQLPKAAAQDLADTGVGALGAKHRPVAPGLAKPKFAQKLIVVFFHPYMS